MIEGEGGCWLVNVVPWFRSNWIPGIHDSLAGEQVRGLSWW